MESKRKLLPIFFALAAVGGLAIGMFLDFPMKKLVLTENEIREEKLRQIINYVDFEYVVQVNTDSLLDLTITDLLKRLDPHSSYIPLEQVAENGEKLRGSFDGVGIEFKIYKDTLTVVKVVENGPSDQAGIEAGNRILSANGNPLFGENVSNSFIISQLKGESGSKVQLEIWDKVNSQLKSVEVERGSVSLPSVAAYFLLNDSTGYLKLLRFAETSSKEVDLALKNLKQQGAKNLVLDLRDNPGGLLPAAKNISDQFLQKNTLIVFTKDRKGEKREDFASNRGRFKTGKIAVLVNEGSASASEIVAGAIQDNDRGLIVGRRTFGKGLVQEEISLKDGSKMRLTTQRYYTPTGRSIQKPFDEYDQRFLMGKDYDSTPVQDTVEIKAKFVTPKGKILFGGGGIYPDLRVDYDTSRNASILYHLALRSNLGEKAFRYVDDKRIELKKWDKESFVQSFVVNDSVKDYFFGDLVSKINGLDDEVKEALFLRIKAHIAANRFGNSAYLEVYFTQDRMITEAMKRMFL